MLTFTRSHSLIHQKQITFFWRVQQDLLIFSFEFIVISKNKLNSKHIDYYYIFTLQIDFFNSKYYIYSPSYPFVFLSLFFSISITIANIIIIIP